MTNLFQILNQFVMLFRKNVIEKISRIGEFFLGLKLRHVFQIHPVYCVAKNQNTKYLLNDFNIS
jgi:hypothetical protein